MPSPFYPACHMKSFQQLGNVPSARPVTADEVLELHAARLLLLLKLAVSATLMVILYRRVSLAEPAPISIVSPTRSGRIKSASA